ncbi:M1 family metallopeptidase [Chitinophaga sp. sic0106]|uniref:M1 family metallopeptidase n=1 Tax=Chitinophaga sp. sic0106 TaxID=2854785 RepID=UPI001C4411D0|nr:M1 family metallopeptidase [Chitinophaga sp. sic0106]MBV7530077.1 M1 family metallopeptidase [Chitinophaga sp. sic0106]
MIKVKLQVLLLLSIATMATAQQLYMPLNIQRAYEKGTRHMSGLPGANYWQNHAAYDIQVAFNPQTRLLAGSESIYYTNRSPDTLREINLKILANLYQKGNVRAMIIDREDEHDGVAITNLRANGTAIPVPAATGTNMMVKIPALAPGGSMQLQMEFSYTLNKNSHIRTGAIDDGAFFIAYFFPRIAVYDDINGWDRIPYTGAMEFYNDFSDFRVSITVPGDYQTWATGDLVNAGDIYQPKFLERIAAAEQHNDIIYIIDSTDLKQGNLTKNKTANTWQFQAQHVTDFAFAISNHYLWQAASVEVDPRTKRRTRVDAVFNPEHADYFEVAHFTRATVEKMSYNFPRWPFPYSHETVFDGLDQMEYPMMVNDNPAPNRKYSIELTDHEVFHTMFPFYMGTNETLYSWMDEGWATIGEWLLSPMIDSSLVDDYGMEPYNKIAGKFQDLPIMSPSNQLTDAYMTNSYPKPALGYLYVKDLLGDSLFLKALHHYIRTWSGKHPQPYDFFYCMNMGAGRNLDWFWKSWFFDNGYPDLALAPFRVLNGKYEIVVKRIGSKPVPVDLTLTFEDGSTQKLHRAIDCWEQGQEAVAFQVPKNKRLKKVVLGSTWVADIHPEDNVVELK